MEILGRWPRDHEATPLISLPKNIKHTSEKDGATQIDFLAVEHAEKLTITHTKEALGILPCLVESQFLLDRLSMHSS